MIGRRRCGRATMAGESGQAVIEFLLLVPVLATTCAIAIQLLMLLHARAIVDYAAFSAARSAAVWLPASGLESYLGRELRDRESDGARRIHMSAALACVPVSPKLSAFAGAEAAAMDSEDAAAGWGGGSGAPGAVASADLLSRHWSRFQYARRATGVILATSVVGAPDGKQMRVVEAAVTYRIYLLIPIVDRMLGRAEGPPGVPEGRARFLDIRTSYTMPLEDELRASRESNTSN